MTEVQINQKGYFQEVEDLINVLGMSAKINSKPPIELIQEGLKIKDEDLRNQELSIEDINGILKAIERYKVIYNKFDIETRSDNTLHIFTKNIYKDSLHFFLEIIQNADDASKGGDKHSLKIRLDKDKIIFIYDERGFNFSDLFAITSLGNSTKKAKLENNSDIGEKGIGFKSIFAIVEKVEIKSKYFNFNIAANENRLSSILEPTDCFAKIQENNETELTLILSEKTKEDPEYSNKINDWMTNNLDDIGLSNPFVFLKNIKKIKYSSYQNLLEKSIEIDKKDIGNSEFKYIEVGKQKYIGYSEKMKFDKKAIISRWKYLEEIIEDEINFEGIERFVDIYFPIGEHVNRQTEGRIYSFLPTNISISFPILLNLDVHLTASRGTISEDDFAKKSEWNKKVADNLANCLLKAYLNIINSTEDDDRILDLKKQLYKYIPITKAVTEPNIYNTQLVEFRNNLLNEQIFYSNENQFETYENIAYVTSKLREIAFNREEVATLYEFLEASNQQILTTKNVDRYCRSQLRTKTISKYPYNIEWNNLFYDAIINCYSNNYCFNYINPVQILKLTDGIRGYEVRTPHKNSMEIVLSTLNNDSLTTEDIELLKGIAIIPIEAEDGYRIDSYEKILESNKEIFYRTSNEEFNSDESKYYVFQVENNGKKDSLYKGLDSILQDQLEITEYDLPDFFDKKFKEISSDLNKENVHTFIQQTYKFYQQDPDAYGKAKELNKIRDFMSSFSISITDWLEFGCDILKDGQIEYIKAIISSGELMEWIIPESVIDKKKYVNYLVFLGLKYNINYENNDIDKISKLVIPEEITCLKEFILKPKTKLQKYYLSFLEQNYEKISYINLLEYCLKLGLFERKDENLLRNMKGNMKGIFILDKDKISNINLKVERLKAKYPEKKDKIYTLNNSSKCIISSESYPNIFNKIKVNVTQSEFINSFRGYGDKFISDLFMLKILNDVLGVNYRWGNDKDDGPKVLTLEDFLSCHEYLTGEESLGELMNKGYFVKVENLITADVFLGEISNLLNVLELNLPYDLSKMTISMDKSMRIEIIKFVRSQGETPGNITPKVDYLVNGLVGKANVLLNIFKRFEIDLDEYQIEYIRDYFEITEVKVKELLELEDTVYTEGIFFHHQYENLKKAELDLKKHWKENTIEKFCESYLLSKGERMQGYLYQCPICGYTSQAGTAGLKYQKFKNSGVDSISHPYFYLVTCLNCNKMLQSAKFVSINNFAEVMRDFEFKYCSDDDHINNHSKMKTLELKVVTYDNRKLNLLLKISYLTLVAHKKYNDFYKGINGIIE